MKKLFILLALSVSLVTSSFSFEWGGLVKNESKTYSHDFSTFSVDLTDSLFFWVSSPIADNKMKIVAEGIYKNNFFYHDSASSVKNIVDIDILKISGKLGSVNYAAGRFAYYDVTGAVFAQNMDGLQIKVPLSSVNLGFTAGYTGLLNELNVSMQSATGSIIPPTDSVYSLAYPYVVLGTDLEVPVIIGNQSLQIEALAFIDIGSQKTNRYFFNATLAGPIASLASYKFATSFGSLDFSTFTNFTSVLVEFYPGDSLILGLNAEYASGKQGVLTPFSGVTVRYIGTEANAFSTSTEISTKAQITYLMDNSFVSADANFIFFCPDEITFAGIDLGLNYVYQIFTDLQLSAKLYAFIDPVESGKNNNFGAAINAALAF